MACIVIATYRPRMATDPFYLSQPWRALRREVIRLNPVCVTKGCAGRSSHADHIVPRRRGGASLDPANVQAMCHSCHSTKTARHDGGFGRAINPNAKPVKARGCDASGRPLDPGSHWHTGR